MMRELHTRQNATVLLPRSMRMCLPLFACYFQVRLRPICRFWYNSIDRDAEIDMGVVESLHDEINAFEGGYLRHCMNKQLMLMLIYSQYPLNAAIADDVIDPEFCDKYGTYIRGIENDKGVILAIVAVSCDCGDVQIYTNQDEVISQYNSVVTSILNEVVGKYMDESGKQSINITIDTTKIRQLQLFDQLQSRFVTNRVMVEHLDYWIMDKDVSEPIEGSESLSHMYIIAGQSNASGRGAVSDLNKDNLHKHLDFYLAGGGNDQNQLEEVVQALSSHDSFHSRLKYFDPVNNWDDLIPNMHKNVDILKNVGVGVGHSFAIQMLREIDKHEGNHQNNIGIIPVAIGGTSIEEWMPDYLNDSQPTYALDALFASYHVADVAPAPNCYYDGCLNIFSCAIRSVFRALQRVQRTQKSPLCGMVWYQGESNSTDTTTSAAYNEKLQYFLAVFRHYIQILEDLVVGRESVAARSSVLPVTNILITTTRPWLKEVHTIRQHQLALEKTMEKVHCIDTLGLALGADNIHLTTASAVYLGIIAASTMSATSYGGSLLCIGTILSTAHQVYNEARGNVSKYFANDSVIQPPSIARKGALPILKTGLKAINFVYGEVDFCSFCKVLLLVEIPSNAVFVDLGCGSGTCIAAAILAPIYYSKYCPSTTQNYFSKIIGIDLMKSKIDDCSRLMLEMKSLLPHDTIWPEINVIYDNFLQVDWSQADVAYTCATCFAQDQIDLLLVKFRDLKVGCHVIVMDNMALTDSPLFSAVGSVQCVASWGHSNAYVYRRVSE